MSGRLLGISKKAWIAITVICSLYVLQVAVAVYFEYVPLRTITFEPQRIRVDSYRGEGLAFDALPVLGIWGWGDTYVYATADPGVYGHYERELLEYTFDSDLAEGNIYIKEEGRKVSVCVRSAGSCTFVREMQ